MSPDLLAWLLAKPGSRYFQAYALDDGHFYVTVGEDDIGEHTDTISLSSLDGPLEGEIVSLAAMAAATELEARGET